ncbi:TIGR01459 family HAD-type hydrolase [Asticcacaulis sp. EMRT-3]|uniref:TIGR01459 family HAD-type hydrolase n=1 Tax=Asticcacaulis sp. EMRT-3 TaxID=3040349 RepID=UPI0024AED07E|nr:TIGR01459 family HAD-type hydrolase [Asticcacaulis sp. EMRT-3]MDI7774906.1 TIGR01459 family HAD-type hydrolase [Asticcacaulis sp. EMRT-3]
MSHPELLTGLSAVADQYDALFCDIWGVIHNGRQHFPPAYEALKRFKEMRGPVILISNSPRPRDNLIAQLASLGIYEDGFSEVVSSGDATREYLRQFASQGAGWKVGPERDDVIYEGIEIDLSGKPDTAAFISCTGPYDDENDVLEQYSHAFTIAAKRRLVMICANPDKVVQRGDKIIMCAGSLADLYASLGGPVIMAGKPYAPIYELCYAATERLTGQPAERKRILAIGDGLPTDVLGANGQGLDLVFIAAGIHAVEATGDDGKLDPLRLKALLDMQTAEAKYVSDALRW